MELRINQLAIPERPQFNYAELKQEIAQKTEVYASLVYTETEIKVAKADKANLNKLKKALNDERIRREKEYMQPFNEFKAEVNEIISLIDKPILTIDAQIKGFEEKKKAEKLAQIQDYYNSVEPENLHWLGLPAIFNEKWLNASVKMSAVEAEIDAKLKQVETDLATLAKLPEFSFEATEIYKQTLDMNKAISEGQKLADIAKRKAEAAAATNEKNTAVEEATISKMETAEEVAIAKNATTTAAQWVSFKALLTTEDALALRDFFNSRNIEFEAI